MAGHSERQAVPPRSRPRVPAAPGLGARGPGEQGCAGCRPPRYLPRARARPRPRLPAPVRNRARRCSARREPGRPPGGKGTSPRSAARGTRRRGPRRPASFRPQFTRDVAAATRDAPLKWRESGREMRHRARS